MIYQKGSMGKSLVPVNDGHPSVIVVDRHLIRECYLIQLEYYDNTNHVVLAYYNASSVKPIIQTCAQVNDWAINTGEKSYIGGRLVVDGQSYTVFHIEPCESVRMHRADFCVYVVTLKERIIVAYGGTLYDVSKNGFDPDDVLELDMIHSKSFGDVHVTVNSQELTISLPDDYLMTYSRAGRLGEEFEGGGKIDADKIRSRV